MDQKNSFQRMQAKKEYTTLLKNKELLELYPGLSGSWKEDKKVFTAIWEQNQDAIKDIDITFDSYE